MINKFLIKHNRLGLTVLCHNCLTVIMSPAFSSNIWTTKFWAFSGILEWTTKIFEFRDKKIFNVDKWPTGRGYNPKRMAHKVRMLCVQCCGLQLLNDDRKVPEGLRQIESGYSGSRKRM